MDEQSVSPQAEAPASAERPSSPEPAAPPRLASLSDAVRAEADANGGDDRWSDAEHLGQKPASEPTRSPDVRSGGRRSQAAEANVARIAELERQLAERDPEKIRADLEASRQREAEQAAATAASDAAAGKAAWYQRVRDVPDRDLSDQDYRDREDYKAEIAAYATTFPKARQTFEAQARQTVEAGWASIQAHIRSEMERSFSKPGVDRDAASKAASYERISDHLYEGGQRSRQPEVDALMAENRKLKAENQQFRLSGRNGLGAARAPITGGRSAAHANGRPDFHTASASDLFAAAVRQQGDD